MVAIGCDVSAYGCSMARLDRVKNLSGLAAWFAANQRLRQLVNLVIVGQLPSPCPSPPSSSPIKL